MYVLHNIYGPVLEILVLNAYPNTHSSNMHAQLRPEF